MTKSWSQSWLRVWPGAKSCPAHSPLSTDRGENVFTQLQLPPAVCRLSVSSHFGNVIKYFTCASACSYGFTFIIETFEPSQKSDKAEMISPTSQMRTGGTERLGKNWDAAQADLIPEAPS